MRSLRRRTWRRWERSLRRALAELWFFLRGLRVLVRPTVALAITWSAGAAVLHRWGWAPGMPGDGSMGPPWSVAAYSAFSLMTGQSAASFPAHVIGEIACYLLPLLGLLFLAEGVLKLGFSVFNKDQNREAWVSTHARASRGHVIVCGLGTVGFRVTEELVALGEQVFAVERKADSPFVALARELGVEVIIGDARAENFLRSLNVDRARSVIVATDDDLANLEIAMDVREIRADVPIVMRLYDQRLAQRVKASLGVQVSVSTSKLAAPLFASAALDTAVVGTHRVGDQLVVVVEIEVRAQGAFAGRTVGDVAAEHRLTVVALRGPRGAWEVQPGVDRTLEVGTRAQMLVPGDRCEVVRELNGGA